MSNGNPFNDRSLQDGENFMVFDFESGFGEEVAENSWYGQAGLPSVNISWVDASLGETSGYELNQSPFENVSTSNPPSNYPMSDAGSSHGSEVYYLDQAYDPSFESSPASEPYTSLIPDIVSQRRNSLPSDYWTHRSLYDIVAHSGDERPDVRRLSWQGAYGQNEQLSDAASNSYHSSRRPNFENLAQLATGSMPMPYPTGARLPAYGHYNYSDPNVTQSVPTNVQRWQSYNSPASSAGELPHLNRTATPEISAQLQSTLFLHDSNDPQLNFDPSSHPDSFSGFDVYPSGTQVPEEHTHFNNSQPIADSTGSNPGSSDTTQVSTSSPRFFVYVPDDSSEAGPSNTPYHMLPETDSGELSLSRNSSKSKVKGEPRAKSVACNYCRSKKNKCVGVSGERCESCTTLNIECTYSESRRGKYVRKSKKKDK